MQRRRKSLAEMLPARMKWFTFVVLLLMLAIIGILAVEQQKSDIAVLTETAKETQLKQIEVQSERSELQQELAIAGTSDYIADKARTLYGYLLPGEIRFKVTNPEALYGEEPVAEIVEEGQ